MSWEAVLKVKRKRRLGTSVRGRKVSKPKPFKPTKPTKPKSATKNLPKTLTTPERFQPDGDVKEPEYEGGSTYPYGKPMIPEDDRMDMNPTFEPFVEIEDLERLLEEGKELPSWVVVITNRKGVKGIDADKTRENFESLANRTNRTMDRTDSIDIPPNERDKHLTMDDPFEEREEEYEEEEEEPQTRASYRSRRDFNPFTTIPAWKRKLMRAKAKKFRRR
jgi:hypothetical protein